MTTSKQPEQQPSGMDLWRSGKSPRPQGESKPSLWARLLRWVEPPPSSALSDSSSPFLFETDRVAGERYRTLSWKLNHLRQKYNFQTVMVTSSVAGEGKSTVALNLAAVLAERSEHRVLLLDCDLRRPQVRTFLGGQAPGMKELLEGTAELDDALHQEATLGFSYVPVVAPMEDPLKLLSNAQRLERVLNAARHRFDFVIVDAPPVLPVSDPLFLAEAVDAIVFVVRAGDTSGRMLSRALSLLRRDKLLGLIFNGTARSLQYEEYARRREAPPP
ncbi:MAG: CpsD/CapB family tyrosine-protein kinase [Myxococcota bacterium]